MTKAYTGPERRAESRMTPQAVADAVAIGIREAVSNPEVWEAAGKAMREQAQSAAGGWLLGGLKTACNRIAWGAAIVAAVYAVGGWGAVVALLKGQAST